MNIAIEKVKVVGNPRTDFSGIEELAGSISEHGLLNPVTVRKIGEEFELVAGERRLRAHQLLGLEVIEANVVDLKEDSVVSEVKLVENIQRKDLNYFEEADALAAYVEGQKCSADFVAKRLGKPRAWVEKRLAIAVLGESVRRDLLKNKLSLGHALGLARVEDKSGQREMLKEALRHGYSASAMLEDSQYSFKNIGSACFDCSDCKKCQHNGSQQSELFETGKSLSGKCMKPKCFLKKLGEHKKVLKKKYSDLGVEAVSRTGDWQNDEALTKGCSQVWGCTSAQKKKLLKDSRSRVVISVGGEEELYFEGDWQKYLAPKSKKKDVEQQDKERVVKRKEVLKNKVSNYMFGFYQEKAVEKMSVGSMQAKALVLYSLQSVLKWHHKVGQQASFDYPELSRLLGMKEKDLDSELMKTAQLYLQMMSLEELKVMAESVGTELDKDFSVTKDFLEIHTKDQLEKLAKELRVKTQDVKKKSDYVAQILDGCDGRVPKAAMKA